MREEATLHLVKLCVGVDSVDALAAIQAKRRKAGAGNPRHVTRHRPRRAEALLAGGSLYWVIGGMIHARQRIFALDRVKDEAGVTRCAIVLSPHLIRVELRPRRPFQGWRYLEAKDAPPDRPHRDVHPRAGRLPHALAAALDAIGVGKR